ncbi:MAG: hypothetical protein LBE09_05160, partial [Christensenellaceae bacterium]|nr:hypothetical protein [Christensenellaceae bacterium]
MKIKTLKPSLFLTLIVIVCVMFIISLFALSLNAHSNIALSREYDVDPITFWTNDTLSNSFYYDAYGSNGLRMEARHTYTHVLNNDFFSNTTNKFAYTGPAYTATDVTNISNQTVLTGADTAWPNGNAATGNDNIKGFFQLQGATAIAAQSATINYYAIYIIELNFQDKMFAAVQSGRVDVKLASASIDATAYGADAVANPGRFDLDAYDPLKIQLTPPIITKDKI